MKKKQSECGFCFCCCCSRVRFFFSRVSGDHKVNVERKRTHDNVNSIMKSHKANNECKLKVLSFNVRTRKAINASFSALLSPEHPCTFVQLSSFSLKASLCYFCSSLDNCVSESQEVN